MSTPEISIAKIHFLTALINFRAAEGNRELVAFGEWRTDKTKEVESLTEEIQLIFDNLTDNS
jgi:hypothetical protein